MYPAAAAPNNRHLKSSESELQNYRQQQRLSCMDMDPPDRLPSLETTQDWQRRLSFGIHKTGTQGHPHASVPRAV